MLERRPTPMLAFAPPARFEIVRQLGEGGMGVVYEAIDRRRGTRVALKTLRSFSAEALLRFKAEFRALQDLQHPNLVRLEELIGQGGQWFFTMELVGGVDLLEWVRPTASALGAYAQTVPMTPIDVPDTATATSFGQRDGGPLAPAPSPMADRPAAEFDEERLRDALAQLARGLGALHAAGKVHRDIKPSNIRVMADGRVVLLDFGLVTAARSAITTATDLEVVGTAAYMAPEQASSEPVGPEADWYSVGVLLYEAMTGRLPFEGAPLEMILKKREGEPPSPEALVSGLPPDLVQLTTALLRTDPRARARPATIAAVLGLDESAAPPPSSAAPRTTEPVPLVGRDAEMTALGDAFTAAEREPVVVLVEGESGIGKSVLVRRFTKALAAEHPEVVVLAGRCNERESVPYKALDGVVDALSRAMAKMPKVDAAALVPVRAALLGQVFPVLRRVEAIAQAPRTSLDALDPQELRARVFQAMRELLVRLAQRKRVLVVIDDLQWADADSLALLGEIVRPPEAPPLLVLATLRTSGEPQTATSAAPNLARHLAGVVRHLPLARLGQDDARALAERLAGRVAPGASLDPATIADEAGGHPLFIDELVRHAATAGGEAPRALKLDDALWTRIERLERDARHVLALLAVADAPVAPRALSVAASLDEEALAGHANMLRVGHLVRASGGRDAEALESYHDRVREAVVARLDAATLRRCHERLALAFEAERTSDLESLVFHWKGAGHDDKAAAYAVRAAEQAMTALAFDRAARLFRAALELGTWGESEARALRVRVADALAQAGLGAEAAREYRAATVGADAQLSLDLHRRAAEQLLRSGRIDEGLAAVRDVLAAFGWSMPRSWWVVLLLLVFRRMLLRLRGFGFRERAASDLSPRELTKIDVCWALSFALTFVDTVRGQEFQARHLQLALRAGEPQRVARALALEAVYTAGGGVRQRARADHLAAIAHDLAKRVGNPQAMAWANGSAGVTAYLTGEFKKALQLCDDGAAVFRDKCTGASWEIGTMQLFGINTLYQLGELKELARRVHVRLREAEDRGDLHAATNLRIGHPNIAWMAPDTPERARFEVRDAMARWSNQGFHLEHFYALQAETLIDLYLGDARLALRRIDEQWTALRRSLLMRVQPLAAHARLMRARAAIAAATQSPSEARALLARAAADARSVAAVRAPYTQALAVMLRAGIADVRGDEAAAATFRRAAGAFERVDMGLYAAAAWRRVGEIEGGDGGREMIARADAWMAEQTIKNGARMARCFVIGAGYAR